MAPLTFAFRNVKRQLTFPPSRHDRILSNPAAEFVDVRAGREVCRRATGDLDPILDGQEAGGGAQITDATSSGNEPVSTSNSQGPKFVSTLDRFVPADEAPNVAEYYQPSAQMMAKFQETLESFTETLKSRKIFRHLQIEPRKPADCDIDYVLKIASLIQEHKEGLENTQTIKKFIRKCCRGMSNHNRVLSGFLSMVPSDVYGSAISGGLSMILVAVENHEKSRIEIQSTLADIPRKLSNIHRVSKAHMKTAELHQCADQVFLSIFIVLERIINKLSMGFIEKRVTKLKGHGDDIKDAIEDFQTKVTEFQEEVDVCAQLRFGRIENNTEVILKKLQSLPNRAELEAFVYTLLYRFSTSHPNFNIIDGTARGLITAEVKALTPPPERDSNLSRDGPEELAKSWLSSLGTFDPLPDEHITELLSGLAQLSMEEKDQINWIMASDDLKNWLTSSRSGLLCMNAQTPPEGLVNPVSFSTATLAFTLSGASSLPVLSFFCGLRTCDSRENSRSGARAIRTSLNAQLLRFVLAKRSNAALHFLKNERLMKRSTRKAAHAKKLFRELLSSLPDGDIIFIILDSFSRLGGERGDKDTGDDIIEELTALKTDFPELVLKILVSDTMPNCASQNLADTKIIIPDEVDGWKNDVNLAILNQESRDAVSQLLRRHQKNMDSQEELSDSSSDTDSD